MQFPSVSLFSAEITEPIVTKILHNIVALVVLLNHAYTWHYPVSHSVSECQSDKSAEFAIFYRIGKSELISEKEVQIVHLHLKCFHSVKRLRKSVQQIMR